MSAKTNRDHERRTIIKLAIILSTNNAEKNWNAFRLGNLALKKGDEVSVFLIGEGVEYESTSSEQFNVNDQVQKFLSSGKVRIIACETCMTMRHQAENETCPAGGIADLYNLIATYDKVITF